MIPLPDFLKKRVDNSCITNYIITTTKSILTIRRFGDEYQEIRNTEDLISGKGKPEYSKEGSLPIPKI